MSIYNNLNPNFYKTVVERGGRIQNIIYSTLDDLKVIASNSKPYVQDTYPDAYKINVDEDFCLYADTVNLCSNLIMPGRNIKIVARQLIIHQNTMLNVTPLPIPDPPPEIDPNDPQGPKVPYGMPRPFNPQSAFKLGPSGGIVLGDYKKIPSSAPPEKQYWIEISLDAKSAEYRGADGKSAQRKGIDAGVIEVIAQKFINTHPFGGEDYILSAVAKGGRGERGQGGMNGSPGEDATNGLGFITIETKPKTPIALRYDQVYYGRLGSTAISKAGIKPKPALSGGPGGAGGAGANGGKGGQVIIRLPENESLMLQSKGGLAGEDGKPGKGAPGGNGGEVRVEFYPYKKGFGFNFEVGVVAGTFPIEPGADGKDGASPNRTFNIGRGEPGTIVRKPVTEADLALAFDSTYWLKLLQHAKNLFYYNPPRHHPKLKKSTGLTPLHDENKTNPAYILLQWMQDTLYASDTLLGGNPDAGMQLEAMRKKEIRVQVDNHLEMLAAGKNIYGKSMDWVPLLSLETYKNALKESMQPFKNIEAEFERLVKEAETKSEKDIKFNRSMAQLEYNKKLLNGRIENLKSGLPIMLTALESYTAGLVNIKNSIVSILEYMKREAKDYVDCSLDNIFKALEMIAFDPKNVMMAAVQGGKLLYDSLTKIAGVDKSYFINKTTKLEGKLEDSATTIFNMGSKRADLLILKLDEFNKEMEKVESKFPKTNLELHNATESLRTLVQLRSEKLIEYNITLSMILKYQNELILLESKEKILNSKISKASDPTLTGTVSYFAVLYQNLRDHMMELVYTLDRAYQYWSIGQSNIPSVYEELKKKRLWVESSSDASAKFSAADVEGVYDELILNMTKQKEVFKQDPKPYPSSEVIEGDIKITIDEQTAPGFIALLKAKNKRKKNLIFPIITTTREPKGRLEFTVANTADKYNIRVLYVRPRLIFSDDGKQQNIDNGTKLARFYIEHKGKENIYQSNRKTFIEFEHGTTAVLFEQQFIPDKEGKDFKTEDGSFGYADVSDYAKLGLYTDWAIILEKDPYVDLSKLTAVEIEFGVLALVTKPT